MSATRGPWAVDGEGTLVAVVCGTRITAPAVATMDRPDDERIAADARLLAAAPEMFALLNEIVDAFDAMNEGVLYVPITAIMRRAYGIVLKVENGDE